MPSMIRHLEDFYVPANIEQYRESLEQFDWKTFLSDNYYPSLDSVHTFLYQLGREKGQDWISAYEEIYERNLVERTIEPPQKVAQNTKKVFKNKKKPFKKGRKDCGDY
jgi:hypothetical protein